MSKELIDRAAKAMALHAGWDKWDTAKDCRDTPSGNEPEDEREYWLELAKLALNCTAGAAKGGNTSDNITQAAANKAAEEGELSALELLRELFRRWEDGVSCYEDPEESAGYLGRAFRLSDELLNRCIDILSESPADRASRQVANKAEIDKEEVLHKLRQMRGIAKSERQGVRARLDWTIESLDHLIYRVKGHTAPPATTGASTARDQALEDAAVIADSFYGHIRQYTTDVPGIGGAIRALKGSVGASTVLTDERITQLFDETYNTDEFGGRYKKFARAIEREVAAQAGQVAVPEDVARDAERYRWLRNNSNDAFDVSESVQLVVINRRKTEPPKRWSDSPKAPFRIAIRAAIDEAVDQAIAAAPSPAKESK